MSDQEFKRIVEVSGVRLEVDLRTAKVIENYKVGDAVKLLNKEYGDTFKSYPGVIVGFDEFKQRPTIVVAFIKQDYSSISMQFAYLNKDSKDFELAPIQEFEMKLSYDDIQRHFNKQIEQLELDLTKKKKERDWFNDHYKLYFGKMFSEFGQDVTQNQD